MKEIEEAMIIKIKNVLLELTIGIILCQDKDKLVAEYALKDINKPVGVSQYKLLQDIPEYLQNQLPKVEDIELHIKDIEELESKK